MSLKENDMWYDAVKQFAEENGCNPITLKSDERGWYVVEESEQEDRSVIRQKHYLPDNIQDNDGN